MQIQLFQKPELGCGKPYKTNGILMENLSKPRIVLQQHWKSITYRRFSKRVLATAETLQNQWKINNFESRISVARNLIKQMVF